LAAYLRTADPRPRPVSPVAVHRVLSYLQEPDETDPVWMAPPAGGAENRQESLS
jgi:hypothetical protein